MADSLQRWLLQCSNSQRHLEIFIIDEFAHQSQTSEYAKDDKLQVCITLWKWVLSYEEDMLELLRGRLQTCRKRQQELQVMTTQEQATVTYEEVVSSGTTSPTTSEELVVSSMTPEYISVECKIQEYKGEDATFEGKKSAIMCALWRLEAMIRLWMGHQHQAKENVSGPLDDLWTLLVHLEGKPGDNKDNKYRRGINYNKKSISNPTNSGTNGSSSNGSSLSGSHFTYKDMGNQYGGGWNVMSQFGLSTVVEGPQTNVRRDSSNAGPFYVVLKDKPGTVVSLPGYSGYVMSCPTPATSPIPHNGLPPMPTMPNNNGGPVFFVSAMPPTNSHVMPSRTPMNLPPFLPPQQSEMKVGPASCWNSMLMSPASSQQQQFQCFSPATNAFSFTSMMPPTYTTTLPAPAPTTSEKNSDL